MGKKQHSKDQLYVTSTEWAVEWGGKKNISHIPYKTLPFDCCAISFRPFETPMCTADGVIFDIVNIVPYLKKFRKHPVTGNPLAASDLTKLKFTKNAEGKYICPVLYKTFNQHSHIVAIRTTGNVYSHEAVKELNLKAGSLRDLMDDTPFTRKDVITIQDPSDGSCREIKQFNHVNEKLVAKPAKSSDNVRHNEATSRIMAQMKSSSTFASASTSVAKPKDSSVASKPPAKPAPARWLQTTAAHAASFTSTTLQPVTHNEIAQLSQEEASRQRYAYLRSKKQKGYAQLQTSHGNINLELHTEHAPMACENFVGLIEKGYYRNVAFHRLIKNFMLQGGDPTGTGTGGESIWGKAFGDELGSKYKHEGRGILSMANSGPATNGSQFFITFKSAPHLDGKHTIFGKIVGGFDTLSKLENEPTDKEDRPLGTVVLLDAVMMVNPFDGLDAEIAEAHARGLDPTIALAEKKAADAEVDGEAWYNMPVANKPKALHAGVGKYLSPALFDEQPPLAGSTSKAVAAAATLEPFGDEPSKKKTKLGRSGFGDFSSW